MTTPPSRFQGPRLKLKRAEHHIVELVQAIESYIHSDPFEMLGFFDERSKVDDDILEIDIIQWSRGSLRTDLFGGAILKVKRAKAIPQLLSLIIGDAIHNIRSSLDLLAVELVMLNQGDTRHVSFPVSRDAASFSETLARSHFSEAGRAAVDALVAKIRPFGGGHDLLHALHEMDLVDKHRLIIPLIDNPRILGLVFPTPWGATYRIEQPIDGGKMIFGTLETSVPAQVKVQAEGVFSNDAPPRIRGFPIVPVLVEMSNLATSIIDEFEVLREVPGGEVDEIEASVVTLG